MNVSIFTAIELIVQLANKKMEVDRAHADFMQQLLDRTKAGEAGYPTDEWISAEYQPASWNIYHSSLLAGVLAV